jgi:signal transduction histidine kinase
MPAPQYFRVALFLGATLIAATVFLLAHWAIDRLSREVTTTSRVLAQFCADASYPATRNPMVQDVFSRLVANLDFPLVITDRQGVPRAWRGLAIADSLVSAEALDSVAAGLPVSRQTRARVKELQLVALELDGINVPIPLIHTRTNLVPSNGGPLPAVLRPDTLGAVHFGEPPVLGVLRWTPYVSLGGTLLLLGLGFWGLAVLRLSEKRTIWVGMAKETAHQLGTPLSSLMGWSEALRAHVPDPPTGEVRIDAAELAETVGEMDRDIDRLKKVASRFSNVGSVAALADQDVASLVREVAGYMRKRLPRDRDVELRERYVDAPPVPINADLLEWAVENLVSNAANALEPRPSWIEVAVAPTPDGRSVEITVADNGRGMSTGEQRRAFEPGYTTRRRGWGLGLPLARRVVEDAHHGRLWIRSSAPGRGTTMAIRLPVRSS